MSLDSIASRVNTVEIGVKSKVSKNNPTFTGTVTGITKAMVGLGSVDNTTDATKPISGATQTALNDKAPLASLAFTGAVSFANTTSVAGITKTTVGLGHVDNTSDENKPVSALTRETLSGKQSTITSTTDVTAGVGTFKYIACTATS